jgi:predicted ester cyclase
MSRWFVLCVVVLGCQRGPTPQVPPVVAPTPAPAAPVVAPSVALEAPRPPAPAMEAPTVAPSTSAAEPVVRAFLAALNAAEPALDPTLVTDDVRWLHPGSPQLPPVQGRAEVLGRLQTLRQAFPDGAVAGQRLLLTVDGAALQAVFRGTWKGKWLGQAPTGRSTGFEQLHVFKLREGRLAEIRSYGNWAAVFVQTGRAPGQRGKLTMPELPTSFEVVSSPPPPQHAELARGLVASYATPDFAGLAERSATDAVFYDLGSGQTDRGVEELKRARSAWRDAFPDLHVSVVGTLAAGAFVVMETESAATHRGRLDRLAPTGKPVQLHGAEVVRLDQDVMREAWAYSDASEVLTQLGLAGAPLPAGKKRALEQPTGEGGGPQ